MIRRRAELVSLLGLAHRLRCGIAPAVLRTMPEDWGKHATLVLQRDLPADEFVVLDSIRGSAWQGGNPAADAITSLSGCLREKRTLLLAVLSFPDLVLGRIREALSGSDFAEVDSWIGLLWVAAAASRVVSGELSAEAGYAALDGELLWPLAARLLFLVSSEPMRSRRQGKSAWWGVDSDLGGSGILEAALGYDTWHLLVAECQRARRAWLDCVSSYESHTYLAQARQRELEAELRALTFRWSRRGLPLVVSVADLEDRAALTAADKTVIDEVTDQHFLPRFDLLSVTLLALADSQPVVRWIKRAVAGLSAAAAIGSVVCAARLDVHEADRLAVAALLVIGGGNFAFGRRWAAPWMLRFPAAATIGVVALISLAPGRWITGPPGGWHAVAVLLAAAFGYLMIEARNHGVTSWSLLLRALSVAATGAAYSVMIALVGLVIIAPAFTSAGPGLATLWASPTYGRAGLALALASSWCLAVGVFSQVLWDDRPITAPLAHLSWRKR